MVALAGGVGAARFLAGLVRVLPPQELTVVVNTGDDRDFFGLRVCPDLDIVTYTLAGVVDRETGWGFAGDTVACLDALRRLRSDVWFRLGDRDLATHIHRSERLRAGREPVGGDARARARRSACAVELLPMSDDPTPDPGGARATAAHGLRGVHGARRRARRRGRARPVGRAPPRGRRPGVLEALERAEHRDRLPVAIRWSRSARSWRCPACAQRLERRRCAVSVSPIIAGAPVKGPADRLLRAVGAEVSALGVARLYRAFCRAAW